MKSIMISIKPEWVEKILNGKKILEIRKSMPKCELPCKVYIYETKAKWFKPYHNSYINKTLYEEYEGRGKIVAGFTLNKVEEFSVGSLRSDDIEKLACLSYKQMIDYFYKPEELDGRHSKQGYAWHIDNLIIYDKPKDLSEFSTIFHRMKGKESRFTSHLLQRPPQSWCYVEVKND